MKIIVPPLKCQGIKTKLVPWIRDLINSKYDRWVEPFMGSGVVGFNINPKKAVFGDSNPHIINFYQAVKDGVINADSVREYLKKEGDNLRVADDDGYAHYRKIRDRFNESFDPFDFLFLSRAGFNGMMRFSKKGKWNIPFCKKPNRFAQAYITKIVNQVDKCSALIKEDWEFIHQDYLLTIGMANSEDLIYCDPPYLGRYTDYYNNWTEKDEELLAAALKKTQAKFILSSWHHNNFRSNLAIEKYWNDFNIITRDHFYHSGAKEENRNSIVEALIFNFDVVDIKAHNHGVFIKPEQLSFIDVLN